MDGDVYNLIPLNQVPDFAPTRTHEPANYNPAPKKFLKHPSTMKDVAEFVMEYINSDVSFIFPRLAKFVTNYTIANISRLSE